LLTTAARARSECGEGKRAELCLMAPARMLGLGRGRSDAARCFDVVTEGMKVRTKPALAWR